MTRDRRIPGMRPVQREAKELLRHALQRPRPPLYRGRPRWVAEGDFGGGGEPEPQPGEWVDAPAGTWAFTGGEWDTGTNGLFGDPGEVEFGLFPAPEQVWVPLDGLATNPGPELTLHDEHGYFAAWQSSGPWYVDGVATCVLRHKVGIAEGAGAEFRVGNNWGDAEYWGPVAISDTAAIDDVDVGDEFGVPFGGPFTVSPGFALEIPIGLQALFSGQVLIESACRIAVKSVELAVSGSNPPDWP